MNRPYIICHMMTSVDGRIDCAMTEHLPGVQEYYDTLDALVNMDRIQSYGDFNIFPVFSGKPLA